jgi:2-phospho-L-lactate guanylyltransferase
MRTAAVLPVKSFARAKQRLGESVSDEIRLQLARAMVADVLHALAVTETIELTILVTRETSIATSARALGAVVLEDRLEEGQSAATMLGVAHAIELGFQRVLCVPGDCPALDPAELDGMLRAPVLDASDGDGHTAAVTIVPDRHGTGTNGLLLSPPDAIAPSFGPDSCERHRQHALAAGISAQIQPLSSLVLDIDTGADLQELRNRLQGHRDRAARTRGVLAEPARGEAIKTTATA